MIDASKCTIKLKLIIDDHVKKAYVEFHQDQTRQSGFILKTGPYGLYLDPPKLPPQYIATYYDENKERYKGLQNAVVEQYEAKLNSAEISEVEMPTEQQLDDCWDGKCG